MRLLVQRDMAMNEYNAQTYKEYCGHQYKSLGNNKHSMTGPKGNREFCFPSTSVFPLATHCFPWDQSWSVLLYLQTQN